MRTMPLLRRTAIALGAAAAHVVGCGTDSPASAPAGSDAPPAPRAPEPTAPAPPTAPPPAASVPADVEPDFDGPARVQLVGRFDTTDPAGPQASWPGSRIVTRFRGTRVSVTLREVADTWMDGAPSTWDVTIDRGTPRMITMTADGAPHVFELAQDLPAGAHEVELYKRSEMQTGVTQFLGFDLHGGRALAEPPRAARHIEAMADSYGTGYGVEKLDAPNLECGVNHAGRWQNFRKAWPSRVAARFGAELEGTVYSGKGLTRGIWPTDDDGLVDYYGRSNPNPAMAKTPPLFDLRSWPPDVILLAQGTVDNGIGNWREVYRDFVVNQLRARAPNAHIFLIVPGRIARERFVELVNGVAAERAAAGDDKVHAVVPGEEQPEEMTGCGFHGSPAYHQRIADEVSAVVAAKTGW